MCGGVTASIRRTGAVAGLAVRAALRTKTVAALLVLLAVCVAVLPGVVKGDGTPAGELQVLLTYTLGFAFGILCLATLWAACALFAAEIDSARMQLSAVKPVRAAEFWMGKWLALLGLNALVLAAVYAGVYGQMAWRMRRSGWADADRPVSRRVTHPVLPTPKEEAREAYEVLRRQDALPKGMSEAAVLKTLEAKADEKYDVINPGEEVRWRFHLKRPVGVKKAEPVTVRIRFDTEFSTREHVTGVCSLSVAGQPGRAAKVALDDFTQNEIEFVVDTRAFAAGEKGADGLRDFEVAFHHTGDAKRVSALMLRFRKDVELLTPGGTFEANLARAACVQWSVLALLAGFGLTLSACFSLPVAAFVATLLLVLTLVGNSVVQVVSEDDEKEWGNRVGIWISRGVSAATRPSTRAEPLTALTRGERLEGDVLGRAALWNVVWLPALFAVAGCWVLRRRELADTD